MAYYWVTIRIKNDTGYDERYAGFLEALQKAKQQGYWSEPTSFWFIESSLGIDQFMRTICAPLDASKDMVLARKIANDESRYFGAVKHADVLKSFLPNVKKLA